MMKQYLAVDSGGTKVLALLYDEQFRPLRSYRTGSMRDNTTSKELIRQSMDALVDNLALTGAHLSLAGGILDSELLAHFKAAGVTIDEVAGCGEFEAGLAAAEMEGDALLALSGTGASLFGRWKGRNYGTGGYGASVSDEGSGYWLAREAFGAAIRCDEGRGEKTILTELLAEQLGRPGNLRTAIFHIYEQKAMSPVAAVASCAPVVSIAAEAGDGVSLEILRRTGQVLAEQIISMVRRDGLPLDLPTTISGSVWRSHPILFRTFCDTLKAAGFTREVTIPNFEPIVGVVIRHYRRQYGSFGPLERERFLKLYADFTFAVKR